MLHLVQSNKMEILLTQMASLLRDSYRLAGDDGAVLNQVLQGQDILVQSPGMAQWIKINLARQLGICANTRFPLPSSFIWQLYQKVLPGLPKESAFTKANMAWKLMAILPDKLVLPEFAGLAGYIGDLACDDGNKKLYQLCNKIADVFDQYLMYRPEWIAAWEQGDNRVEYRELGELAWQPELWRALVGYTRQLGESSLHRGNQHQLLLRELQKKPVYQQPLFIFGISALPWQQLEVLQALSQSTSVYLFWLNPSCHYWADVLDLRQYNKRQLQLFNEENKEPQGDYAEVGNPLLARWGKIGRDFQSLLLQIELQQHDYFVEPTADTLLSKVQADFYHLQFRGAREPLPAKELLGNGCEYPKATIHLEDRSIELASCHSIHRELEVLYDNILHWFDSGQIASPDDIIVMVPDVAKYAPMIDTVFGQAQPNKTSPGTSKHIPYAISDRTVDQEHPAIEGLLCLLQLHRSRFSLSEILALFEIKEVHQKFGVAAEDLPQIRDWCQQANIRWGIDGQDKARFDLPAVAQNTWYFGLERILSGYAVLDADDRFNGDQDPDAQLWPVAGIAEIEGAQTEALGNFIVFLEDCAGLMRALRKSTSLIHKIEQTQAAINAFFAVELVQEAMNQVNDALDFLSAQQHRYPGDICQDVFVMALKQELQSKGVGQRFLAGKVNFCTLMPMRSIPFKVVCLLGLDDLEYPRRVNKISFDLVNHFPARLGDRSRRLDDRYLFLEALLSARDKFYISYNGRSLLDNSPKPASILVNELIDYCCLAFLLEGDISEPPEVAEQKLKKHLLKEYALQPFSPENFTGRSSFQSIWFDVAKHMQRSSDAPPEQIWSGTSMQELAKQSVSTAELIACLRNPVRHYFVQQCQTQFPNIPETSEDDEPLSIAGLDRYLLLQQLLQRPDMDTVFSDHNGVLPVGTLKQLELDLLRQLAQSYNQRLFDYCGVSLENLLPATEVVYLATGASNDVESRLPFYQLGTKRFLLRWRPGKLRTIDKLQLMLDYCLYLASGYAAELEPCQPLFLAKDKLFTLGEIDIAEAQAYLLQILTFYHNAHYQTLAFFPETSWTWLETQDREKTEKVFMGGYLDGEGLERHISRVFPELPIEDPQFSELAESVLSLLREKGEML